MKRFILIFIILCLQQLAFSQEKRALVIGIDQYNPPADVQASSSYRSRFQNLEGCKNDALSVRSVIAAKFLFNEKNIDSLFDANATRANILNAIRQLLANSKPNDVAFIYYAGHGSQVANSLSKEIDHKDETIVPFDTWKEGVADIRDKELASLFNSFIDKGIRLTVIMDCCHSGSISRGATVATARFRYMAEANYDAKDPSSPEPPEQRANGNFLILSAAQDNEFAEEQVDDNNTVHGAFTIALLEALNQQSVDASAINIFSAIRAILKSNGKKQEPVLGGSAERQRETLLGLAKGTLPDRSLIAVENKTGNNILLQGGFALSLYKGNELTRIEDNDTTVLKIDTVLGVNRSSASVIKGKIENIRPGELFEVSNWVSADAPLLKLYIPAPGFSYNQVLNLARIGQDIKNQLNSTWVNNLEKTDPYTSIFFIGNKCYANTNGDIREIKNFNKESILSAIKKDSTVYMELPPSKDLAAAIKNTLQRNKSIKLVDDINDASYMLYGTIGEDGLLSYGLRRVQPSARDSLESMPVQTKSFGLTDSLAGYRSVADSLYEYALRLSKIRGWMQLVSPSAGTNNFPFHLEIFNTATGRKVDTLLYRVNDQMSLHLVANDNAGNISIIKKYVYVFVIDRSGNMISAYPNTNDGNVANRFPKYDNNNLVKDFSLFDYRVTEPVGTDNFFLLASDEPISNYSIVFNQEGVRGIDGNGLSNLLNLGNEGGTRGFTQSPSNWCLLRLSVKSMH